jgi:hypothetical protein
VLSLLFHRFELPKKPVIELGKGQVSLSTVIVLLSDGLVSGARSLCRKSCQWQVSNGHQSVCSCWLRAREQ